MTFKIGFKAENEEVKKTAPAETQESKSEIIPKKSVVEVYFEEKHTTLHYYNDKFDLKCGDIVYVDGKLEGVRGRVVDVSYSFKIKLSDYKRVIFVADTMVHGKFLMTGSHFLTFERDALPKEKIITWFKAPNNENEEFENGSDGSSFSLDDLKSMGVSSAVMEKGHEYYMENRVKYISVDASHGYAIVVGSDVYEVEFDYIDGAISNLVCNCFCTYKCKHEFAAMLQLQEIFAFIEKRHSEEYEKNGYFAAINKGILFALAVDGREDGNFCI